MRYYVDVDEDWNGEDEYIYWRVHDEDGKNVAGGGGLYLECFETAFMYCGARGLDVDYSGWVGIHSKEEILGWIKRGSEGGIGDVEEYEYK
jgi:hypothetical protein